jgi:hypothetical protein
VAKIKKRKLRWQTSASLGVVGYKLYWAEEGGVNYDSESAMLGNVGEVVLPGDIPSFPQVKGPIEIGITAVNEIGNESDMTKIAFPFQFAVPDPPANLTLEPVKEYHVSESPHESESPEDETARLQS